jgi:hypothetical protein
MKWSRPISAAGVAAGILRRAKTNHMLSRCVIGMEAGGGSHHSARKFEQYGHQVRLISPQFVKPFVKWYYSLRISRATQEVMSLFTTSRRPRRTIFAALGSRKRLTFSKPAQSLRPPKTDTTGLATSLSPTQPKHTAASQLSLEQIIQPGEYRRQQLRKFLAPLPEGQTCPTEKEHSQPLPLPSFSTLVKISAAILLPGGLLYAGFKASTYYVSRLQWLFGNSRGTILLKKQQLTANQRKTKGALLPLSHTPFLRFTRLFPTRVCRGS